MKRTLLPEITALIRPPVDPSLQDQLTQLRRFINAIQAWGPLFSKWYLGGDTKEEALRYEAFGEREFKPAALAVLRGMNSGKGTACDIGFWNGQDGSQAAGLKYLMGGLRPWTVNLRPRVDPTITTPQVVSVVKQAAVIWSPLIITAHPPAYMTKKVFRDRPGVGNMLYLPRSVTQREVPEAGALVPVIREDRHIGTIIISVVDQMFSDLLPDHVRLANSIEVRLVDQDLLPRYADL
ncbi:Imm52 family immunity protein [Cupriavidus nantongensis]|uniref:Imm52 family immunity protein n=1 Tax=Cupriavidus nantongensis TaxID=1796606 RepID=UPI002246EBA7|nr:Imm52 family immunity protein [Cupriavidus nantongensis]